jgi:hypothetical protein
MKRSKEMNSYLREQVVSMHMKDLQREAEQYRLAARCKQQPTYPVRRTLAMCGVQLMKLGMYLKQLEVRSESQPV